MVGGENITGSERVADAGGRQYHIGCAPGELARYILLAGDPDRVRSAEGMLRDVSLRRAHREFATITGLYEDTTVSLMSTGIGCDNTEIAVVEAAQCVERPTFIRVGSSGALQPHCHVGDLVISDRAVRRENTSLNYVAEDHVPRPHPDVLEALVRAAEILGYPFHVGATCSTSSFYAGQGRQIEGFPILDPGALDRLRDDGVLNFEMEMSTLFTISEVSTRGLRAGGVCAVFANRATGKFATRLEMAAAQERCLLAGLKAAQLLNGG